MTGKTISRRYGFNNHNKRKRSKGIKDKGLNVSKCISPNVSYLIRCQSEEFCIPLTQRKERYLKAKFLKCKTTCSVYCLHNCIM